MPIWAWTMSPWSYVATLIQNLRAQSSYTWWTSCTHWRNMSVSLITIARISTLNILVLFRTRSLNTRSPWRTSQASCSQHIASIKRRSTIWKCIKIWVIITIRCFLGLGHLLTHILRIPFTRVREILTANASISYSSHLD